MRIASKKNFVRMCVWGKNRNNERIFLMLRVGKVFRLSIRANSGVNIEIFGHGFGTDY